MKEAIAVLVNDLHVSKDNIQEFVKNWDELLMLAKNQNVEDIVIGGDIFTTRSSQTLSVLLAVKHALDKAVSNGLYVTIAEGNHDCVDSEEVEGYNHLWCGQKGISVIDSFECMRWGDTNFALLVMSYYPENGTFLSRLEAAVKQSLRENPDLEKSDLILYIHEGVHGALGDFEIEGELPQEPLLGYKAVLCGHYHNRTRIKGTNIEYIGSSRQHNFGEDEEKGYTVLYDDGSTRFVKNEANTRYRNIELVWDEIEKFNLETMGDPRYRYKLKLSCSEKESKLVDRNKLLEMGFNKVEVVTEKIRSVESVQSDIQEKYDKQGIRKEYVSYCDENSIDSALGLKYLEN